MKVQKKRRRCAAALQKLPEDEVRHELFCTPCPATKCSTIKQCPGCADEVSQSRGGPGFEEVSANATNQFHAQKSGSWESSRNVLQFTGDLGICLPPTASGAWTSESRDFQNEHVLTTALNSPVTCKCDQMAVPTDVRTRTRVVIAAIN